MIGLGLHKSSVISDFTPNGQYLVLDGVNDYVEGDATNTLPSTVFTYVIWARVDSTVKKNNHLFSFANDLHGATQPAFNVIYLSGLNRLRVRGISTAGAYYQREYPLHSNTSQTGITDSGIGWVTTQRGNTDSDGFTLFVVAVDLNEAAVADGITTYWNNAELTSSVSDASNNMSADLNIGAFGIGEQVTTTSPSAGCFQGGIDTLSIYNRVLSASEVSQIWSSGRRTSNPVTSGLVTQFGLEGNVDDTAGLTTLVNSGGTFVTY